MPAKSFGVKVGQYMIGFGPTIFSRRRGETEYGVKAIPLGGYISMAGMYPPARAGQRGRTATTGMFETLVQDADAQPHVDTVAEEQRAFYRLPVWKRVIIMVGGPFMNLVLARRVHGDRAVRVRHSAGVDDGRLGLGVPRAGLGETREECAATDPEAPAFAAGVQPGDRIVSIDGTPIEDWADSRAHPSCVSGRAARLRGRARRRSQSS